jgi:hypothetical protein
LNDRIIISRVQESGEREKGYYTWIYKRWNASRAYSISEYSECSKKKRLVIAFLNPLGVKTGFTSIPFVPLAFFFGFWTREEEPVGNRAPPVSRMTLFIWSCFRVGSR